MIRLATLDDYETVKEMALDLSKTTVYSKVFKDYVLTRQLFEYYLHGSERICFLAEKDGEPVGFAACDLIPWLHSDVQVTIARLAYIYVRPEFRKEGFGKELEEAFEYWGKVAGANFYFKGNNKTGGYKKVETIYMKEVK